MSGYVLGGIEELPSGIEGPTCCVGTIAQFCWSTHLRGVFVTQIGAFVENDETIALGEGAASLATLGFSGAQYGLIGPTFQPRPAAVGLRLTGRSPQ